jgi:hypothetical protein
MAAPGAGHHHDFTFHQFETLFLANDPSKKPFRTNGLDC